MSKREKGLIEHSITSNVNLIASRIKTDVALRERRVTEENTLLRLALKLIFIIGPKIGIASTTKGLKGLKRRRFRV